MSDVLVTDCYLILEPTYVGRARRLDSFKVAGVRKTKPREGRLVHLKLRIPRAAFEPFLVSADIEIHEEQVSIEVTADELTVAVGEVVSDGA